MSEFLEPAEKLYEKTRNYVDLRLENLKLQTAKGLSQTLSKLMVALLLLGVAGAFVLVISFGGVLLLGELIDSYAGAAGIVAGVLLIALVVLFLLRKRLFKDTFVPLFVNIFFGEDE